MPTVRPVGEWNAPFIGLLRKREATEDESTTERDFCKGSLLPFSANAVKKEPLLKQTLVITNYSKALLWVQTYVYAESIHTRDTSNWAE